MQRPASVYAMRLKTQKNISSINCNDANRIRNIAQNRHTREYFLETYLLISVTRHPWFKSGGLQTYKVWSVMQEKVYKKRIKYVDEMFAQPVSVEPGPDLRGAQGPQAPTNRGPPTKPFIFYLSFNRPSYALLTSRINSFPFLMKAALENICLSNAMHCMGQNIKSLAACL